MESSMKKLLLFLFPLALLLSSDFLSERDDSTIEELRTSGAPSDLKHGPYIDEFKKMTPSFTSLSLGDTGFRDLSQYNGSKLMIGYGTYDSKNLHCRFLENGNSQTRTGLEKEIMKEMESNVVVYNEKSYLISRDKIPFSECIDRAGKYLSFPVLTKTEDENEFVLNYFKNYLTKEDSVETYAEEDFNKFKSDLGNKFDSEFTIVSNIEDNVDEGKYKVVKSIVDLKNIYKIYKPFSMTPEEFKSESAWIGVKREDCLTDYSTLDNKYIFYDNIAPSQCYIGQSTSVNNMYIDSEGSWRHQNPDEILTQNRHCIVKIDSPDFNKPKKVCASWWKIKRDYENPKFDVAGGLGIDIDINNLIPLDVATKIKVCTKFENNECTDKGTTTRYCTSYYDPKKSPICSINPKQERCFVNKCQDDGYMVNACDLKDSIGGAPKNYIKLGNNTDAYKDMIDLTVHAYECPACPVNLNKCLESETVSFFPKYCLPEGGEAQLSEDDENLLNDNLAKIEANEYLNAEEKVAHKNAVTAKIKNYTVIYPSVDSYKCVDCVKDNKLVKLRGTCPDGTTLDFPINEGVREKVECEEYIDVPTKSDFSEKCNVVRTLSNETFEGGLNYETAPDPFEKKNECLRVNSVIDERSDTEIDLTIKLAGYSKLVITKAYADGELYDTDRLGDVKYFVNSDKVTTENQTGPSDGHPNPFTIPTECLSYDFSDRYFWRELNRKFIDRIKANNESDTFSFLYGNKKVLKTKNMNYVQCQDFLNNVINTASPQESLDEAPDDWINYKNGGDVYYRECPMHIQSAKRMVFDKVDNSCKISPTCDMSNGNFIVNQDRTSYNSQRARCELTANDNCDEVHGYTDYRHIEKCERAIDNNRDCTFGQFNYTTNKCEWERDFVCNYNNAVIQTTIPGENNQNSNDDCVYVAEQEPVCPNKNHDISGTTCSYNSDDKTICQSDNSQSNITHNGDALSADKSTCGYTGSQYYECTNFPYDSISGSTCYFNAKVDGYTCSGNYVANSNNTKCHRNADSRVACDDKDNNGVEDRLSRSNCYYPKTNNAARLASCDTKGSSKLCYKKGTCAYSGAYTESTGTCFLIFSSLSTCNNVNGTYVPPSSCTGFFCSGSCSYPPTAPSGYIYTSNAYKGYFYRYQTASDYSCSWNETKNFNYNNTTCTSEFSYRPHTEYFCNGNETKYADNGWKCQSPNGIVTNYKCNSRSGESVSGPTYSSSLRKNVCTYNADRYYSCNRDGATNKSNNRSNSYCEYPSKDIKVCEDGTQTGITGNYAKCEYETLETDPVCKEATNPKTEDVVTLRDGIEYCHYDADRKSTCDYYGNIRGDYCWLNPLCDSRGFNTSTSRCSYNLKYDAGTRNDLTLDKSNYNNVHYYKEADCNFLITGDGQCTARATDMNFYPPIDNTEMSIALNGLSSDFNNVPVKGSDFVGDCLIVNNKVFTHDIFETLRYDREFLLEYKKEGEDKVINGAEIYTTSNSHKKTFTDCDTIAQCFINTNAVKYEGLKQCSIFYNREHTRVNNLEVLEDVTYPDIDLSNDINYEIINKSYELKGNDELFAIYEYVESEKEEDRDKFETLTNYNSPRYFNNRVEMDGIEIFPAGDLRSFSDDLIYHVGVVNSGIRNASVTVEPSFITGASLSSATKNNTTIFEGVVGFTVFETLQSIIGEAKKFKRGCVAFEIYKKRLKIRTVDGHTYKDPSDNRIVKTYTFDNTEGPEEYYRYTPSIGYPFKNGGTSTCEQYGGTSTGKILQDDFAQRMIDIEANKKRLLQADGFNLENYDDVNNDGSFHFNFETQWFSDIKECDFVPDSVCNKTHTVRKYDSMKVTKEMTSIYKNSTIAVTIVVPSAGDYIVTAYDKYDNIVGIIETDFNAFIQTDAEKFAYVPLMFGQSMRLADGIDGATDENTVLKHIVKKGDRLGAVGAGNKSCRTLDYVEWGGGVSGIYAEKPDVCDVSNIKYVQDHSATRFSVQLKGYKTKYYLDLEKPLAYPNRVRLVNIGEKVFKEYDCYNEFGECVPAKIRAALKGVEDETSSIIDNLKEERTLVNSDINRFEIDITTKENAIETENNKKALILSTIENINSDEEYNDIDKLELTSLERNKITSIDADILIIEEELIEIRTLLQQREAELNIVNGEISDYETKLSDTIQKNEEFKPDASEGDEVGE
jgi:hypothetical protein